MKGESELSKWIDNFILWITNLFEPEHRRMTRYNDPNDTFEETKMKVIKGIMVVLLAVSLTGLLVWWNESSNVKCSVHMVEETGETIEVCMEPTNLKFAD